MAVMVFDVNETLLDLSGLDGPFAEVFGDRAAELKRLWFARLVHTSMVLTMLEQWQDFADIGRAVLADLAVRIGAQVEGAQVDRIVGTMRTLDAHADVAPALRRLSEGGARLVALTNSGQASAEAQLAHAGIAHFFERIMSVDAVKRFKPHRGVYDHCRDQLALPAGDLTMVATHDWDCAGAMAAGWRAAFVKRPGQAWNPLYPAPQQQSGDMESLAGMLLASSV